MKDLRSFGAQWSRLHGTSLLLVALALGFGGYVLLVDADTPTTKEKESRKDRLLSKFSKNSDTEATIVQGDRQATLTFKPTDAGESRVALRWGESSGDYRVNEDSALAFLDTLETTSILRVVGRDLGAETTGIGAPRSEIRVKQGSQTQRVRIGKPAGSPLGSWYVQLDEGPVVVIGKEDADKLLRPIDLYRNPNLSPYLVTELNRVRIVGEARTHSFLRASWNGFLVEGTGSRVAANEWEKVVQALSTMSVVAFASGETGESRVRIELEPKDHNKPKSVIEVGGACDIDGDAGAKEPLVFARRLEPEAVQACVPIASLGLLQSLGEDVRDKDVFRARADEVETLKRKDAMVDFEIARKGTGWHLRKPTEEDVAGADLEEPLKLLLRTTGELVERPELDKLGLQPAAGTIMIERPALEGVPLEPDEIEIGRLPSGVVHVRRRQDGAVLRLDSEGAQALAIDATVVRSRTVMNVAPTDIHRVVVMDGNKVRIDVKREPSEYVLQEPKGYRADSGHSLALFQSLGQLTARRWVAGPEEPEWGLNDGARRVKIALKSSPSELRTLLVGARTTDGSYARWEDKKEIFVLPGAVEARLDMLPIDCSLLDFGSSTSVQIRIGTNTWELRQERGQWRWLTAAPLAEKEVVDALGMLRAEGTVHLGASEAWEGFTKPTAIIEAKGTRGVRIVLGREDTWNNQAVYYVRRGDVNATLAVARSKLAAVVEGLKERK